MSARLGSVFGFVLLATGGLALLGAEPDTQASAHAAPTALKAAGVDHLFRLSPRLYSGAQPEGDAGFDSLRRLGIKTIITVDGAQPDVARAHRFGLRYVHLPIGYDGVPDAQRECLVKSIQALPGPVFVHCHHGKHRGPAAAGVCALATEGWSREQALAWLEQAGTAREYHGLFESIASFTPPSDGALAQLTLADLPERAKVPGLVDAMVEVDQRWDRLKAIRQAGFRAPANEPDLDPPHEALLLVEQFREAARLADAQARGPRFLEKMQAVEQEAASLKAALAAFAREPAAEARSRAEASFQAVERACARCHGAFRN